MRICPKCGYHDSLHWRPRANRPYCEYSSVDNIGGVEPELIQKIKDAEPAPYFDGHFVYHISKTGKNVERIELELFQTMRWGQEPTEKRSGERSIFFPWPPKMEPASGQIVLNSYCTKKVSE